MKKTAILSSVTTILVLILCLYIYMYVTGSKVVEPTNNEVLSNGGLSEGGNGAGDEVQTDTSGTATGTGKSATESITVSPDTLSDGQKKLLETFGVDTNNIEITPEMISCAEEKVGEERMQEIQNGATPSFIEGMTLIGCYE